MSFNVVTLQYQKNNSKTFKLRTMSMKTSTIRLYNSQ